MTLPSLKNSLKRAKERKKKKKKEDKKGKGEVEKMAQTPQQPFPPSLLLPLPLPPSITAGGDGDSQQGCQQQQGAASASMVVAATHSKNGSDGKLYPSQTTSPGEVTALATSPNSLDLDNNAPLRFYGGLLRLMRRQHNGAPRW